MTRARERAEREWWKTYRSVLAAIVSQTPPEQLLKLSDAAMHIASNIAVRAHGFLPESYNGKGDIR